MLFFNSMQKQELYQGKKNIGMNDNITEAIRVWQNDVNQLDGLSQMTYVDTRFSLADDLLLYGDKMSMANSLEARVPMLDNDLMAFVEKLPPQFRLRRNIHKYLYRKAVADWVQPEVLQRPKRGFETPMDNWLTRDLQSFAHDLWFSSSAASRTYFNSAFLQKLLVEHASKRVDHRRQIFCLLSFEIWHRIFVDRQSVGELSG